MDTKLQKLENIVTLLESDKVTYADLEKAIALVAQTLQEWKVYFETQFENKNATKTELGKIASTTSSLETKVKSISSEVKSISKGFTDKLNSIPKARDFTADIGYLEDLIQRVEKSIPKLPEEISGDKIIGKINISNGKIDRERVDGLDDELKRLEGKIGKGVTRVVGGGRASHATKFYPLTADGTTLIFSVPKSVAAILISSDFPTVLMENNGFTINKTRTQIVLTTAVAPSSGSQLLYQYTEVFNT